MLVPSRRPEFVYKYCSASRAAQVIADLTFYFTPARALNDLYEFRATALYRIDDMTPQRVLAKRLMSEGWCDDYEDALEAARSLSADTARETFDGFMAGLVPRLGLLMTHSGVTCFSSHRNNQRMWGTYGDSHGGAVLEFSTDEKRAVFASHLTPVAYTNARSPICPSALVTPQMELDLFILGVFFSMKSVEWKEENEWRLLLLADSPQNAAARIVPFERASLLRVFVGPRVSAADDRSIRDAAARHSPPVPVFKREIDEVEAIEDLVGFEEVNSLETLEYWARGRRTGTV
jgi:hypothetical protein